MPASLIVKPIEAHFISQNERIDQMSPYCDLILGAKHFKTEICKRGGANPTWHQSLVAPIKDDQKNCFLEIKDEHSLANKNEVVSVCEIDLEELRKEGTVRKWYSLIKDGKCEGDILIESSFLAELPSFFGTKSAPPEQQSLKDNLKKPVDKETNASLGRPAPRKMSDVVHEGRGWNLFVPGEDLEDEMDKLNLSKSKSLIDLDEGAPVEKLERRKSFWEKMLNM